MVQCEVDALCFNKRPYFHPLHSPDTKQMWQIKKNKNKGPDLAWFNVHVLQDLFQQDWSVWFLVSLQR